MLPVKMSTNRFSVSVFFPFYNELTHVQALVSQALEILPLVSDDFEIILVNDGSTDGTAEIIERLANSHPLIKAVHHAENLGYGVALRSGFKAASKDIVFYTDGDQQFDLEELPRILEQSAHYDIVSCYRFNRKDGIIRRINSYFWGKLVEKTFTVKIRDVDCAFKVFRRSVFDNITIESTGSLVDTEVLVRALKAGFSITQLPVNHHPRLKGEATGAKLSVILKALKELVILRRRILTGAL